MIDMRTLDSDRRYRVEEFRIVDPLDVSVLAPTRKPTLTLITCYPFRYIGSAPDRFVVRARAMDVPAKARANVGDQREFVLRVNEEVSR